MKKQCSKCLRDLEHSDFYWKKDGRSTGATCKSCRKAQSVQWSKTTVGAASYRRSAEKYRASEKGQLKQAEKNRSEDGREANRRYKLTEKGKLTVAKYRATDKSRERMARHNKTPKARATRSRIQAGEKYREMKRKWSKTPLGKEASARSAHKRRMLMCCNGGESTLTAAEWNAIKEDWGNRCAYCLKDNTPLTRDHVVPLSKGGAHTKHNVVPACRKCNCCKGDKDIFCIGFVNHGAFK